MSQESTTAAHSTKVTRARSAGGAGSILLCGIALFVILPLGLATFEVWRFVIARSQLQYICDAAALAATANLLRQENSSAASSPSSLSNSQSAQLALEAVAVNAAEYTFKKNSVLGAQLTRVSTTVCIQPPQVVPTNGKINLNVEILNSQRENLSLGDPGAKGMKLTAVYGYKPMSSQYLGLGLVPLSVSSEGGIPPIDLVLCFDVSASMDDGTSVTAVKRFWDGNSVSYLTPPAGNGTLLDVAKPITDGTKVNAVGPQNLSTLSAAGNTGSLIFSESPASPVKGLRALGGASQPTDTGRPPGNYSSNNPSQIGGNGIDPSLSNNAVTDLVVNLDGNRTFTGWTDPDTGLQFPNMQTLVEAARGNLDTQGNMQQALVLGANRPAWLPATAPNPMYQRVYFAQANRAVQPMMAAKTAAIEILRSLDKSTDLHCGLVSFADYLGYDADSTWGTDAGATTFFIDSNWPPGGAGNYPLPLIRLDAGQPNLIGQLKNLTNLDRWFCPPAYAQAAPPTQTIVQLISKLVATGKSNVAAALTEAVSQLSDPNCTRPDSEKIILLISDGKPDAPGGGGGQNSPAAQACYDVATNARGQGIRIISIDVATTGDADHAAFMQKLATLSRGFYIGGTSTNDLNLALRKIVTQLVALR